MKALIVAENNVTMNTYADFLNSAGFDVIKYSWLMKALDNVEEIAPHIVFISASDYPRHWKTFVQHMKSPLLKENPSVFLLISSAPPFSDEEKKKALALGVRSVITETLTEKEKLLITDICPVQKAAETAPAEKKTAEIIIPQIKNTLTITHPSLNISITGEVREFSYPIFNFYPADPSLMRTIRFGQILQNCVLSHEGKQENIKVQVRGTGLKIEMCILS